MSIPKLDRLKSVLMTSGLQVKDPALFQVIHTLIEFLRTAQIETTAAIATGGSGGGSSLVLSLSSLLGRGDSGPGTEEEITIGSGLVMTGTTLSASGGGGSGITVYEQHTEPMAAVMGDFWIVT